MNDGFESPDIVDSQGFSEHVPGNQIFDTTLNNTSYLAAYRFSSSLPETPAPGTLDYTIGVGNNGAVRGDCKMNGTLYKKQELIAGQKCTLLPAFHDVSWQWQPLSNHKEYCGAILHLSNEYFTKMLTQAYDKETNCLEYIPVPSADDVMMASVVQNLYNKCHYDNSADTTSPRTLQTHPMDTLYIDSVMNFLAMHILSTYCAVKYKKPNVKGGLSTQALNRTKEYISANYQKNIALDDLAYVAGLSCYHFSRLFKKSTGVSPYSYVTRYRVDRAKELLMNTPLMVSDIAYSVGYESLSHFSRAFAQIVGVSPGNYRKVNK